MQFSFW